MNAVEFERTFYFIVSYIISRYSPFGSKNVRSFHMVEKIVDHINDLALLENEPPLLNERLTI